MLITKTIEIDMGHRVPNHKSKCRNPHGHRYKVEVGVDDKVITKSGDSSEGMVIDFGDLKYVMMKIIDEKCDHGFMIYNGDLLLPHFREMKKQDMKIIVVPFIPTAENISKYWYEELKPELSEFNIAISYVKVWETPTSTAIYTKEDETNENIIDPSQRRLDYES